MEKELISEGKCLFCDSLFSQRGIGRHLATHLSKMEKEAATGKPETFYHIAVRAGEMFLHILVRGSAKIKLIDTFLRKIWLECCGHLSAFSIGNEDISMNGNVGYIFLPGTKIRYDYDFGTTTTLELNAKNHYQLALKEDIILLSSNEPLNFICSVCESKTASCMCSVCQWHEYAFFCESCAEKHAETCEDFIDFSQTEIVNSPRMGECGYEGGTIDKARDGHYKPRNN